MRKAPRAFVFAGLAITAIALALAVWLGDGMVDPRTGLIAAGVLAVGDVLAALWAAGPEERKRRPLAWVRCGLAAAALSFVGLWAVVAPAAFIGIMGGSGGEPIWTYAALAFALVGGVILIWATHGLAWRRVAPKADA